MYIYIYIYIYITHIITDRRISCLLSLLLDSLHMMYKYSDRYKSFPSSLSIFAVCSISQALGNHSSGPCLTSSEHLEFCSVQGFQTRHCVRCNIPSKRNQHSLSSDMAFVIRMHSSKGRERQMFMSFLHAEIQKYKVAVSPTCGTNNLLSNRLFQQHALCCKVSTGSSAFSDSAICAELYIKKISNHCWHLEQ